MHQRAQRTVGEEHATPERAADVGPDHQHVGAVGKHDHARVQRPDLDQDDIRLAGQLQVGLELARPGEVVELPGDDGAELHVHSLRRQPLGHHPGEAGWRVHAVGEGHLAPAAVAVVGDSDQRPPARHDPAPAQGVIDGDRTGDAAIGVAQPAHRQTLSRLEGSMATMRAYSPGWAPRTWICCSSLALLGGGDGRRRDQRGRGLGHARDVPDPARLRLPAGAGQRDEQRRHPARVGHRRVRLPARAQRRSARWLARLAGASALGRRGRARCCCCSCPSRRSTRSCRC